MLQDPPHYNDQNSSVFNLPPPVGARNQHHKNDDKPITCDLFLKKMRKNLRQIKRENESDPLMHVTDIMNEALHSFSVIYLTMIGFIMVPETLSVRCSKCPAEYTVKEMESYSDDELNQRHASFNPRCSILELIWRQYRGALRLPSAEYTQPLPPKVKNRLPALSLNSFNLVTSGQPMIKVQGSNISNSSTFAPSYTTTGISVPQMENEGHGVHAGHGGRSLGEHEHGSGRTEHSSHGSADSRTSHGLSRRHQVIYDEGFQDDIISDSLPDEEFSGSFPRTGGEYADYDSRLQSFSLSWQNRAKKKSRPSPETLAEAGFYECPDQRKDAVKCHSCELVLFGWNDKDDIWHKHALQSPSCPYVRERKGEKFIQDLVDQLDEVKIESQSAEDGTSVDRRAVTREDLIKFDIPPSWISNVSDMGFSLDALLLVYLWKRYLLPPGETQVFEAVDQIITWILSKKDEAERNYDKISEFWPGPIKEETEANDDGGYGTEERLLEDAEQQPDVVSDGDSAAPGDETQMCKICFSKPAIMLLRPCSHMVSCESCTRRLKLCPICRDPISAVIPVLPK